MVHVKRTKNYRFWLSETRGLIRQVDYGYPQVCVRGVWRVGSPYVMDAITGMGEDPYSCGEYADQLTLAQAEEYAAKNRIDLYVDVEKTNEPS
jgi:hypothetical protein